MRTDCTTFAKKCDKCHRLSNIHKTPHTSLTPITSPWSFAIWGIDLVGPLATTRGRFKYLVVAVDYFTKWVEVEPLMDMPYKKVYHFTWKNFICRYGLPYTFITDHSTHFDNEEFEAYCAHSKIHKLHYASGHPQSKGQT